VCSTKLYDFELFFALGLYGSYFKENMLVLCSVDETVVEEG